MGSLEFVDDMFCECGTVLFESVHLQMYTLIIWSLAYLWLYMYTDQSIYKSTMGYKWYTPENMIDRYYLLLHSFQQFSSHCSCQREGFAFTDTRSQTYSQHISQHASQSAEAPRNIEENKQNHGMTHIRTLHWTLFLGIPRKTHWAAIRWNTICYYVLRHNIASLRIHYTEYIGMHHDECIG